MTDRELLEAAAKAAGVPIYESTDGTLQNRPIWVVECGGAMGTMPYEQEWNPLRDDGDALRLAVKLRSFPVIEFWSDGGLWVFMPGDEQNAELLGTDPYAATRRAIVRAAAEIGRSMK